MLIERDDLLANWIKRRITQICDAEPVAFGKYVIALLKKDVSESKLREICNEQLDVFLASNTSEFVDSLFEVLGSRSYLRVKDEERGADETSATANADTAAGGEDERQPTAATAATSARPSRRRISPPRSDGDTPVKDDRAADSRSRRRSRSRSPYQPRRRPYAPRDRQRRSRSPHSRSRSPPPSYRRDHNSHRRDRNDRIVSSAAPSQARRVRCRDFEEKGLCHRGDMCEYDHGPDPIVLDTKNVDNFHPDFGPNPPPPGLEGNGAAATGTTSGNRKPLHPQQSPMEAYNPEAPSMTRPPPPLSHGFMPNFSVPPPPIPQLMMHPAQALGPYGMPPMGPMGGGIMRGFRGGYRGRGRGRYGPYGERVKPNLSTTIEVRRIPPEDNKLGVINNHFSQFGEVTNIQISFDQSPDSALVTFAKLPDAQAAMKSEKAILDNRFIQVSWHKPPPPPMPAPPPAAPSADAQNPQNESILSSVLPAIPLATQPSAIDTQPVRQLQQTETARRAAQLAEEKLKQRNKDRQLLSHIQNVLQLKSALYQKQATELKNVAERVGKTTDEKKKAQGLMLLKQLDTGLKATSKEIHELDEERQMLLNKQKPAPLSDNEEEEEEAAAPEPESEKKEPEVVVETIDVL